MATPPRPTTISIPMQPRDRSEACPDVKRCQLEIAWDDGRGALSVHNGPEDRRLVEIGLKGKQGGCDATVRIAMIDPGGLVAVGSINGEVWEQMLGSCVDNPRPLFAHKPVNLMQVRYDYRGERISLFHYTYTVSPEGGEPTTYKAVSVLRRERLSTIAQAVASGTDLQIHGALSPAFDTFYIAISVSDSGARTISYERYTWNEEQGLWGQKISGPVGWAAFDAPQGSPAVDRAGRIYAARSEVATPYNEEVADSAACIVPGGEGGGEISYHLKNGQESTAQGHLFDIDSKSWSHGYTALSHGLSIGDGDYHVATSGYSSRNLQKHDETGFVEMRPYYYHIGYARQKEFYSDYGSGTITVGNRAVAPYETGLKNTYTSHLESETTADSLGELAGVYFTTLSWRCDSYIYENGNKTPVAIGGWIFVQDDYVSYQLETRDRDYTYQGQNTIPCPTWLYEDVLGIGLLESQYSRHRARWPVTFDCHSCGQAFHVADQMSGDWYAGALINDSDGGPYYWRIFKNGKEVDLSCVGNLVGRNFSTLYYR